MKGCGTVWWILAATRCWSVDCSAACCCCDGVDGFEKGYPLKRWREGESVFSFFLASPLSSSFRLTRTSVSPWTSNRGRNLQKGNTQEVSAPVKETEEPDQPRHHVSSLRLQRESVCLNYPAELAPHVMGRFVRATRHTRATDIAVHIVHTRTGTTLCYSMPAEASSTGQTNAFPETSLRRCLAPSASH